MLEQIELHVPLVDATDRLSDLRQALLQIPGVHSVGAITRDDVAAHARLVVGYDAEITNPIVVRDELGKNGFTVTFAAEKSD